MTQTLLSTSGSIPVCPHSQFNTNELTLLVTILFLAHGMTWVRVLCLWHLFDKIINPYPNPKLSVICSCYGNTNPNFIGIFVTRFHTTNPNWNDLGMSLSRVQAVVSRLR